MAARQPTPRKAVIVDRSFFQRIGDWFRNLDRNDYERITLITLILVLLLVFTCNHKRQEKQITQSELEAKNWRDKYGNAHSTATQQVLTPEESKRIYDSIADVLDIPPRVITRYVTTDAGIDTVIVADRQVVTVHDTVWKDGVPVVTDRKVFDINYTDPTNPNWLSIKGQVPSNPQTFDVKLNAKLNFTEYSKRTGFLGIFGKKQYYTDIGTDNPYINITNGKSYLTDKKATLKVRPGIGIGLNYNPFTKELSPGVQAGIYLFKSK